ncbi:MAG TPA: TIGR01777 family oxidoreductase [Chthoniobacteraceae bacterium]|nr:TIGR01777 family oxidoreductase [Chthoniobacteraceae bacterium]
MKRRLIIPGGSGFLGRRVAEWFAASGWDVTVLSRQGEPVPGVRVARWDGATLGDWKSVFEGAEAVLNLAGRSVNCRYNSKNRAEILDSRVNSTRILGEAIAGCTIPPKVWLNSSTATIYRHAEDRPMDDETGEIGSGFSVGIALAWEKEFFERQLPATRRLALRTAMVMGPQPGGPFVVFHRLARLGLGGTLGSGRQMVSWLHDEDFCRAVEWLIDHEEVSGPINVSAPNPLPNREFMREVRRAARAPIGLPATRWMLEVGALILRTETELPLKSRWVLPSRLKAAGFSFNHPDWPNAALEIVGRIDSARSHPG